MPRSDSYRETMRKSMIEVWKRPEHMIKVSESMKGDPRLASNLGKPIPESVRKKISLALKGKMPKNLHSLHSDKTILEKKGKSLIGNKNSLGCVPPNKGKHNHLSEETIRKMSEAKKGERHPKWQGGISSERESFSASKEWRKVKRKIVERDSVCFVCGIPYVPFEHDAHHIIPFKDKEKRLLMENLILLCKPCHRKIHSGKIEFVPSAIEAAVARIKEEA